MAIIVISPLIKKLMHLDTLQDNQEEELAGYKEIGENQAAGMFPERETKPDTKPI